MSMKNYDVCLPMTGTVYVTVEADSEEAAIEKALSDTEITMGDIEDWECHRQISQGNVLYASTNDAFAELALGEEDDQPPPRLPTRNQPNRRLLRIPSRIGARQS